MSSKWGAEGGGAIFTSEYCLGDIIHQRIMSGGVGGWEGGGGGVGGGGGEGDTWKGTNFTMTLS